MVKLFQSSGYTNVPLAQQRKFAYLSMFLIVSSRSKQFIPPVLSACFPNNQLTLLLTRYFLTPINTSFSILSKKHICLPTNSVIVINTDDKNRKVVVTWYCNWKGMSSITAFSDSLDNQNPARFTKTTHVESPMSHKVCRLKFN